MNHAQFLSIDRCCGITEIFLFRELAVVMKKKAVEFCVSREVFVNLANMAYRFLTERGEPLGGQCYFTFWRVGARDNPPG